MQENDDITEFKRLEDWEKMPLIQTRNMDICPICGGTVITEGHCKTCMECFWSLCNV